MTHSAKEKRTVSLDRDLVEAFSATNLSAEVNAALQDRWAGRQRQAMLAQLVAELDAIHGPADEQGVAAFVELLGGPVDDDVVRRS